VNKKRRISSAVLLRYSRSGLFRQELPDLLFQLRVARSAETPELLDDGPLAVYQNQRRDRRDAIIGGEILTSEGDGIIELHLRRKFLQLLLTVIDRQPEDLQSLFPQFPVQRRQVRNGLAARSAPRREEVEKKDVPSIVGEAHSLSGRSRDVERGGGGPFLRRSVRNRREREEGE
jgi:hypothetical protein